jgi:hypothetical protein
VKKLLLFALLASGVVSAESRGAVGNSILSPMTSFGGGDGYIGPGERTWLTTNTTERGMAFNPASGNLLIVSRSPTLSIRRIDGTSGADVGTMSIGNLGEGVFPLNMIAADPGGAVYAANLSDGVNSRFWIYLWTSETAEMIGSYRDIPLSGARLGDSFDVIGRWDDGSARLIAGYGATPAVNGNNGYAWFTTSGGPPFGSHHVSFPGTPPDPGDHRLGLTFLDDEFHVLGSQGGVARLSQSDSYSATLTSSIALASATERLMDYTVVNGLPLLATADTATSIVRVYDMSNPSMPLMLDSRTNLPGASNDNSFGVGQVRWGATSGATASLYVLNTNNGIQAFTVTLPEPAGICILAIAALGLSRRRR